MYLNPFYVLVPLVSVAPFLSAILALLVPVAPFLSAILALLVPVCTVSLPPQLCFARVPCICASDTLSSVYVLLYSLTSGTLPYSLP